MPWNDEQEQCEAEYDRWVEEQHYQQLMEEQIEREQHPLFYWKETCKSTEEQYEI